MSKMFLARYATTSGKIQLVETRPSASGDPQWVWTTQGQGPFKIGRDIFEDEEKAIEVVKTQIAKKKTSLRKQLEKLDKIEIKVVQ